MNDVNGADPVKSIDSDAEFGVRRLVLVHGRDQARQMVEPQHKGLVDIAAEVLADDAGRIGITYTGFCLTGLPHKKLPDEQVWEKKGHRVTLLIEPGRMRAGRGAARLYGVPYGARARMILLYLQTQAVRTTQCGSPFVHDAQGLSFRPYSVHKRPSS